MSTLLLAASALAAGAPQDEWQMVWSDEFDAVAIDDNRWTLADDCWGGGNEEQQCYTRASANHTVQDGKLAIIARKETWTGPAYPPDQRTSPDKQAATRTKAFTSARLTTAGKAAWLYGKVQVRARLPQGQGTWPAIWMLPEHWAYGGWARSGEIDIMEAVNLGEPCASCSGGKENRVLGTIHFGGEAPRNRYIGDEVPLVAEVDGYHLYEIEWDKDGIVWRVDGAEYERRVPHEWHSLGSDKPGAPFDKPFHLILNLAIGGHLPEGRNRGGVDESGFPKRMEVDFVRVWQKRAGSDNTTARTSGGN